jgi:hypothetical protein
MIERLIDAVDTLLGALQAKSSVISPGLESVTATNLGTVTMMGPSRGLFVRKEDPFGRREDTSPDPLTLTFHGRVVIGSNVANPPQLSSLRASVRFLMTDNQALTGIVNAAVPVAADGTYTLPVNLLFRPNLPRPTRLVGRATVEGTTATVESDEFQIENARLDWFLEQIEAEEQRANAASGLAFLASIRKMLLPSGAFDRAIRRSATVTQLYNPKSDTGKRWVAAENPIFDREPIRISHALIGIEGNWRQNPQPPQPIPVESLGNLVTWSGDLGSALQEYLFQRYFKKYFPGQPDYPSFEDYVQRLATREQLIGDIDGINLAPMYNATRSLTTNLRAYYGQGSRKRFSRYVQTQEGANRQPVLALQTGAAMPKLSAASRQFLANEISFAATAILAASILQSSVSTSKKIAADPYPSDVTAALEATSPEVKRLTDYFADFVEQGLAQE